MDSFATLIKKARKARHFRLADVVGQLHKTNGQPISLAFLSAIEHGQRVPPTRLIPQFAQTLKLPEDVLYFALGLIPPDIHEMGVTQQQIISAFQVLRQMPTNNTCNPEHQTGEIAGEEDGSDSIQIHIGNQAIAELAQQGNMDSFARLIKKARKANHLRLSNVATQILKIDGQHITAS